MESLAIILPVHNAAASLEQNIVHLLQWVPQLVRQLQIIIVDDGSLDGSADIAQRLAARFTQVEVVNHGHHHGKTTAIKSGLARVRCDLTFIQATTEIEENKLRAFLSDPASLNKRSTLASTDIGQQQNTDDRLLVRLAQWGMALKEHQSKTRIELATTADTRYLQTQPTSQRMPVSQYSSLPEKRLQEISRRDWETTK